MSSWSFAIVCSSANSLILLCILSLASIVSVVYTLLTKSFGNVRLFVIMLYSN